MRYNMIKSIRETPGILKNLKIGEEVERILENDFNRVIFIGCGSSYFSSLAGAYVLNKVSDIQSSAFPASEFMFHFAKMAKNSLVIASSRSGNTAEVVEAIKVAKQEKATVVGVTCNGNSAITELADIVIAAENAEEPNIPATKSFSAITYILQKIAIKLAHAEEMEREIEKIPDVIKNMLKNEERYRELAKRLAEKDAFIHLGSGSGYIAALEGALKIRETTYTLNEVFPALEFRHGPMALTNHGNKFGYFIIAPKAIGFDAILRLLEEIKHLNPILITNLSCEYSNTIQIPWQGDESLILIPAVLPFQIIAYYISVYRGYNPDYPKKLVKFVDRF
ncbi:SIS domain-containing protein [Thermococcus barophilus]|uniref:Glucosamine--fructose-6-phosphate aminotransferase, sugar isomerase (SIS) domain (GlmS) n=1 Tax=Thermococcus barophilus TaxID=55802 RepID=A0A0S1X9L5_THEBA|nr:SIS domain-containing protein [Thermococcus barophilus]ALM74489.1 Glucosamine--fructose-6-phosphate aminotransferase, sugar isomerase (SIS) domain (GlmS) [Thermococcus barophilus]